MTYGLDITSSRMTHINFSAVDVVVVIVVIQVKNNLTLSKIWKISFECGVQFFVQLFHFKNLFELIVLYFSAPLDRYDSYSMLLKLIGVYTLKFSILLYIYSVIFFTNFVQLNSMASITLRLIMFSIQ